MRIADTVRALAPRGSDIDAEIARLLSEEREEVDEIVPVAGARELLDCLRKFGLDCEITVVFEDSDIGIAAVRNASCPVLPSRRPASRRSSIKSIGLKTLHRFQSNAPIKTYQFVSCDPLD